MENDSQNKKGDRHCMNTKISASQELTIDRATSARFFVNDTMTGDLNIGH